MHENISFKANFIKPTTILTNNNTPKTVSFVRLDPESISDMNTMRTIANSWGKNKTFVTDIIQDMDDCTDFFEHMGKKFFAITLQKDNFENLSSDNLLGLAEIIQSSADAVKLKYLQVHPEHTTKTRKHKISEFKHIGTAIINALTEIFPNKIIRGEATTEALDFYLGYGFQKTGEKQVEFIANSKKK